MKKEDIKNYAFSLVEMLMALLVASLLMAALAPVMTKKTKENINITAESKASGGYKIFTTDDADCEEVTGKNYMKCAFTVPNNVEQINVYMQGAGGGGAAAIPSINEICEFNTEIGNISTNTEICKAKYNLVTSQTTAGVKGSSVGYSYVNALVVPGMQNLEAVIIGAGGGGGGGIYHSKPVHQNDCESIQAGVLKYLTAEQNGGNAACVTKYAVGDEGYGGPEAAVLGNTAVTTGAQCDSPACCWRNISGSTCTVDPSGGRTGCSRPVCTWDAANNACNRYNPGSTNIGDWSLPTEPELRAWFTNLNDINNFKGQYGLQLCDWSTNTKGTSQCHHKELGCSGSYNDSASPEWCHPQHIWSKTSAGTDHYKNWTLEGGTAFEHPLTHKYTRKGARCLTKKAYTTYSGGGGGSGAVARLQANAIVNEFLKNRVGSSIHLFKYGYFKGAPSSGSTETAAQSGDSSVSDGMSTGVHWHSIEGSSASWSSILHVAGGHYGYGAKIDGSGTSSGPNSGAGTCWTDLSGLIINTHYTCKNSDFGNAGTATSGGKGGSAVYTLLDGRSFNCFGDGGSPSNGNENGKSMTCYGGGGGGGSATLSKNGSGSDGGKPYTEIRYQVKRKGASGGGGGGGASIAYRSIPVTAGQTIYFYVGRGGAGGLAGDVEGKDGGDTWFELLSTGKVVAGGGLGGKKGNNDNIIPIGGIGGLGGTYSNANKATIKKNGEAGQNGYYSEETSNSTGGNGGMNDNSTTKTCGGHNKEEGKCANGAINGQSFTPVFETLVQTLLNKSKADSGQGGGGGAYTGNPENGRAGDGGKGTDGYIYIRWNVI